MHPATLTELALIADDIYHAESSPGQERWSRLPNTLIEDDEGFDGALYDCGANLVVAFRGTTATSLEDIKADLNIMADNAPKQLKSADKLFALAQKKHSSNKEILIVGHSLGGGLCQLIAAKYSATGVSFNGPGMVDAAEDAGITVGNCTVLNVVLRWDPISSFGDLIGKKLRLPNPESMWEAHYQTTVIKAVRESQYYNQTAIQVYDSI